MPDTLTLSRAARLANVSRGDLQARLKSLDIETFEGSIRVADLLEAYPDIDMDADPVFERVRVIREEAFSKRGRKDTALPEAEVLMSRLHDFQNLLTRTKASLNLAEELVRDLSTGLSEALGGSDAELRATVEQLRTRLDKALSHRPHHSDREAALFAKDALLSLMSATVKLLPSGHEYFVAGRDTLLEAALKAGLHLDYGCASGNCGKCRVRVLKGDVSKVRDFDYVFSAREREQGYVLACSHTAVTDLLVEASEALAPKDLPAQEVRASVRKVAALGPDLYQVYVQTPRTQTLRFMAGQRVDLTTEDGQRLCLPVASCPCDARNLQFIVRAPADSKLLATLQGGGSNRPTVLINGPHGEFLLEEESERPAVLISVGDGIAPIKSLAEHAIAIDRAVTLHLLRIDELPPGSHIGNLCRSWHDALDNFSYARLPSTLGPGDTLKELLQRFPRLDGCDLYVAAPQAWLTGFREALDGADTSPNTLKLDAADY